MSGWSVYRDKPHVSGERRAGVYVYTQAVTGLTYIGSTVNSYGRYIQHTSALKRGKHCNRKFQRAYNKDPRFYYQFHEVTGDYTPVELLHRVRLMEQETLDRFDDKDKLLNIATDTLFTGAGMRCSPETKEKIRKAMTGRFVSAESRRRRSESLMGHKLSPETRRKISDAHKTPERLASAVERLKKATIKNSISVLVDGVRYDTIKAAAVAHGIGNTAAYKRFRISRNPKFSGWVIPDADKPAS